MKFKIGDIVTTHRKNYWLYEMYARVVDVHIDEGCLLTDYCYKDGSPVIKTSLWFKEKDLILEPTKQINLEKIKKEGYEL